MTFTDADVRDVLLFLERATRRTMDIDPDVGGKISVSLERVAWRDALKLIASLASLSYSIEDSVIRVAPRR
jgi:type II secretory pathway component HofQ